jgi:hypothetical protein
MLDRQPLRDPATHVVPDDAREVDAQRVEQTEHAFAVPTDAQVATERAVAAPVAQEVADDEPVARRHEPDDVAPQVR